jgi:hypothetical protein
MNDSIWPSGHPRLFSGPESQDLWKGIHTVSTALPEPAGSDVFSVLYTMGCKLQELEAEVERLRVLLDERTVGDGK